MNYLTKGFVISSLISALIVTTFPLITQFYIKYLYKQYSLSLLLYATLGFCVLFLFKLILDSYSERRKIKYYLKVEKTLKEKIFERHSEHLENFLNKKSSLIASDISLFLLYLKTKQDTLLDLFRILVVSTIIFFYDKQLFRYLLYALPVLLLFYVISKKIQLKTIQEGKTEDFSVVLSKAAKLNAKERRRLVSSHLESMFRKKRYNRSKNVILKSSMNSFLSFFRIFYLAYFGYYAITGSVDLAGLIVGLLYLTLFIRPFIHLIELSTIYTITKNSRRKMYELLK